MTIWGKSVSSYIRFAAPVAVLILLVGITRLTLSLNGTPLEQTRWFSMNAVMFAGLIYLAVRIQTSGFGSYKQLLPVVVILNTMTHVVSVTGIVIGIVTGNDNVFTAPEYAFGGNGRTWTHVAAHATVGMVAGALIPWLIGCGVLVLTRKLGGRNANAVSGA